jgi:cytoskeletal protein RodZ
MPRRSAAVYRRRRLVVIVLLVLFVAAIGIAVWLLIARPWAAAETATPPPATSSATPTTAPTTGTESPSPDPSAEATPAIVACEAKDIEVSAVTDAETYAAGVLPRLSISLTNKGTEDCTIDVGSTTQVFTVSSGADVWWRSTDCQENPSSMIATLTAGTTVTSKDPVTWDRTRSSVETCAQENRQRAPGGGASYHVEVSIGGFPSVSTAQILLY